jgi:hypothetical protein
MYGTDADGFVTMLMKMRDVNFRRKLSSNSKEIARRIFSQENLDEIVRKGIEEVVR